MHTSTLKPTSSSPWRRGEWSQTPADIKELWATIGEISFASGPTARTVWRGMASDQHEVKSSLVRHLEGESEKITEATVRERERQYLSDAREWGLGLSEFGQATDLHLLAMLQHHGAPTRLIDVTYNPLTALWFACESAAHKKRPGVLVAFMATNMEPFVTTSVPSLSFDNFDQPETASLLQALEASEHAQSPVMIVPRKPDLRMSVQEGLFITSVIPSEANDNPSVGLPPADPEGFRKLLKSRSQPGNRHHLRHAPDTFSMVGLIITPQLKAQLLPILESSFNRSARTMFPDLSGFAASIPRQRPVRRGASN